MLLIALAARVDASPADDPGRAPDDAFAEAIRYANILTGDDPDQPRAADLDDGEDESGDAECDDDERDDDQRDEDACDDDDRHTDAGHADDHHTGDRIADDCIADDRIADDGIADDRDDADDRHAHAVALAADVDDEPDRSASFEDMSSDLAGAALAGHVASELAMLDAGAADPGAVAGDDVSFAVTSAGAAETYESWMRHQRPSPWGRLDVGVAWRQRWSEPVSGMARRYDEVWLVATWRR